MTDVICDKQCIVLDKYIHVIEIYNILHQNRILVIVLAMENDQK